MSMSPLNENIDLKDHYLAFIELENFGIEKELPDERFVVSAMRIIINESFN